MNDVSRRALLLTGIGLLAHAHPMHAANAASVHVFAEASNTPRRHELAEASATLVVRDGGHIELRLQVPWAEVLRVRFFRDIAPRDAMMQLSNQSPASFAKSIAAVEAELTRRTLLAADGGVGVPFGSWRWPTAREIQAAIRDELMSRVADGARFEHSSRLPVTADVVLGRTPVSIRAQFPALLGPVLLTVTRPSEEWLRPGRWSSRVPIGGGGTTPPSAAVLADSGMESGRPGTFSRRGVVPRTLPFHQRAYVMADDHSRYAHDASDKKLDRSAMDADAKDAKTASHPHAGHDPEKIRRHDDAGKDRLFEGRIQRDDADKESNRNRLEKDVQRHHHSPDEVGVISDVDTHPKK